MPISFKQLFTPPILKGDDPTRTASLPNQQIAASIIWSALIITLLLIPLFLLFSMPLALFWVLIAMFLVELVALYLYNRKKIKAASLLLTFVGWAVLFLPAFLQGGLSSPFIFFPIVMVMVAVLLLGTGYAILLGSLTIVTLSVTLLMHYTQFLPQWIPSSTPPQTWLTLIIVISVTGALLNLFIKHLHAITVRAREHEQLLEESNHLLQNAQSSLEQRVAERTAHLERHARQQQALIEIASTLASIRDPDALLNEIVALINAHFGYQDVNLFLADRSGQALMLRASNSNLGKRLIESGFTLKVGQASIVGNAAETQRSCLAMDITQDALYLQSEDLMEFWSPELGSSEFKSTELHGDSSPETRNEMALPLITGGRLLGVLDIQSKSETAAEKLSRFDQESIAIMQTLVEHIAIAIENIQLSTEKQQTIEAIQRAYSSMSREAWQKLLRSQPEFGYLCSMAGEPVVAKGSWSPDMLQASRTGEMIQSNEFTLAIPIKIRDQVTGVIKLRKPEEARGWSKDEIDLVQTLSDRLSTALESAQLYEETRRRAERERLTGEITAKVRASNDPQVILATAVHELRRALHAERAQLLVKSSPIQTRPDLSPENELLESSSAFDDRPHNPTTAGDCQTKPISTETHLPNVETEHETQSNDEHDYD